MGSKVATKAPATRRKQGRLHTDSCHEFTRAFEDLGWNRDTLKRPRSETHGMAQRAARSLFLYNLVPQDGGTMQCNAAATGVTHMIPWLTDTQLTKTVHCSVQWSCDARGTDQLHTYLSQQDKE